MGTLVTNANPYYTSGGDHGNYRYLSLSEIIDSFSATYVGKGKLCESVDMSDISFHAIRGLQELSYDTLRSKKDWEVVVPGTLVVVLPDDYVNYVKLSWSDDNGIERIIYPARTTSNPLDQPDLQDHGGFDVEGGTGFTSNPYQNLNAGVADEESTTWTNFKGINVADIGDQDADEIDDQYGELLGQRYGIDPQYAQVNGSFYINETSGKFHFSSNLSGKTLVIKYISDGIVTNYNHNDIDLEACYVPKLAEEAIYKHILYGVLLARRDTDPNMLALIKKERFAETRKAKIRLSNLKVEELTQVFRGSSKQIKH